MLFIFAIKMVIFMLKIGIFNHKLAYDKRKTLIYNVHLELLIHSIPECVEMVDKKCLSLLSINFVTGLFIG